MFSVVIPIFNHARYLKQAVWSALRAPLVKEVLLLDDGSSDGSRKIAAQFAQAESERVRDLTPKGGGNRGAFHRLNELVEAAGSEWVAILNSDDTFVNGRFESIAGHPDFDASDFLFGNLLFMDERGALMGSKRGPFNPGTPFPSRFDVARMVREDRLLDLLVHQNYVGTTSNMVFRKSLCARVGGFANFRYVHDWDFALRAMSLGRPLYVQRYLTAYRMHSHNTISESSAKVNLETVDLFSRFLEDFPAVRKIVAREFAAHHACTEKGPPGANLRTAADPH